MSVDSGSDDAIVVGVDGSEGAARAVRWAASTAAQRNLDVRIVHAFESIGGYYGAGLPAPQQIFDSLEQEAQALLKHSAETVHEVAAGLRVHTELEVRPPVPVLLERSQRARMVVLGSSGHGGYAGMRVGSTAIGVAAHAPCPVAVVRGREQAEGPVVVGVDGSPTSERAIAVAFEEAAWRRTGLVLGSTSQALIQHADCPVLVVHPEKAP